MKRAMAFQRLQKRLEAKVGPRRDQGLFDGGGAAIVVVPMVVIGPGVGEGGADGFFDAHARGGIAARAGEATEIAALGVFSESELDSGECAFEGKFGSGLAPAELDDDGLAADGVGRARPS